MERLGACSASLEPLGAGLLLWIDVVFYYWASDGLLGVCSLGFAYAV